MRSLTKDILASFYEIDWCSNCGKLVEEDVFIVKTLSQARSYYSRAKWKGFKLLIHNRYNDLLPTDKQYNEIKELVTEISDSIEILVRKNYQNIFKIAKRDKEYYMLIRSDLAAILQEVEFLNIVEPIFFYPVLYPWYKKGNLPCGWDGKTIRGDFWHGSSIEDLPEGRLRVF